VVKGQKMGCAEAIQTGVVYFHRYYHLSVSVAYVLEKSIILTLKTNLSNSLHPYNHFFIHRNLFFSKLL